MICLKHIGIIRSKYRSREQAPFQGKGVSRILIDPEYGKGLKDVESFSHIHVLYYLHKSNSYTLSVRTPWDSSLHGIFATRTPNRPSPVGYAAARLIERKGRELVVEGLDAIDGTPVIDIKPYIPKVDCKKANSGWLERKD